jgi:hypothetical protein
LGFDIEKLCIDGPLIDEVVLFEIAILNYGEAALEFMVNDPNAGIVDWPVGPLSPGEGYSLEVEVPTDCPSSNYVFNEVTVQAYFDGAPVLDPLSASDQCYVFCENPFCDSAIEIPPSGTQIISGNTSGANNDAVPSCRTLSTAPDDLYVFTLDTETFVTSSVSGFDTVLYIREVCDEPGSELACNDDHTPPGGYGSLVSETLPAGEYFLIVDGYGSNSGAYELTVDFGSVLEPGIYGKVSGSCGGPAPEDVYMVLYENLCGSSTYVGYVLTAADGSYSFTDLSNGNYRIHPTKGGYTFSPSEQILDFNNTVVTGVNFTAN